MYLPFESMPGHTRLWIYQASRSFTATEKTTLEEGLKKLCDGWMAHNVPLATSYSIQRNRFVILAVDEQQSGVSGCSIDGSVHYLQGLQKELGIDFFDRTQVAFLIDGEVKSFPVSGLKTLFENRTLTGESVAFNNLVDIKSQWEKGWMIAVKESWLNRYLPNSVVAG